MPLPRGGEVLGIKVGVVGLMLYQPDGRRVSKDDGSEQPEPWLEKE